jgi:PEP-CTERM motif
MDSDRFTKFLPPLCLLLFALTLACAGAAHADTWSAGQIITYQQNDWGSGGTAASVLSHNFITVYPTAVVIAGEATGGFSMAFDNAGSIEAFLPSSGPIGALSDNYFDPAATSSGVFGGEVLALELDVDFSDAGVTLGSSGIPFGNLVLENFDPSLDGLTVRQILADANTDLGGGTSPYTIPELGGLVGSLTDAFDGGTPSPFAQESLDAPGGTTGGGGGTPMPEPSSILLLGIGMGGLGIFSYRSHKERRDSFTAAVSPAKS